MDTTTSWILKLVDKITKPAKTVMKSVEKMTEGIEDIADAVNFTEKETKVAIANQKKYYQELETSIEKVEKELADLQKRQQNGTWDNDAAEAYDKATARLQRYKSALQGAKDDLDDLTKGAQKMGGGGSEPAVKLNHADTKAAYGESKKYYQELKTSIKSVEKELEDLERIKKNGSWTEAQDASRAYDQARARLERYRDALQGAEHDMDDLGRQLENFDRNSARWTDLATGINQGVELIQKAADGLDFSVEVANLTSEVQRMTDLTGPALDELVAKSRRIAKVYDEDAAEIARAANVMTKQIGGSYEENLVLIEDGFKKGANINKDFLDQLKEYPVFVKQLGLSSSQAISLMAQAGKKGIFSDKAIDSLKEGNMALREMQQTQVDALAGIGMKPEDVVGKTPFEAMQLITSKMKDMAPQARQMILTDLFKGAGEDAGLAFIEGLSDMDLDLTHLSSVEQAGAGIKGFFADISTWAGQTFGDIGIYAQQIAPLLQIVAAAIPIYSALSTVTWLQTAATSALSVAQGVMNTLFYASPIGWIVLAVAALVGVIVLCWKKFEGFREVIFKGWEALKLFGTVIKDFVIDRIKGILTGITGLGKALYQFFTGEWKAAWETGKQAASDLMGIDAGIKAGKKFSEGWNGAMKDGQKNFEAYEAKNADGTKKKSGTPSVNSFMQGGAPETLGKIAPTDKKSKKEGSGLDVGSGSGGIKSITMTLDIKNYFNVSKDTDTRALADKIVGNVNDRLRDSVISLGG